MAESNTSFIQKCFEKWLEENPDGTYPQFVLLCKRWMHMYEDIDSEVRQCIEIGDKQKLSSVYGKFMKGGKDNEGTEGNV